MKIQKTISIKFLSMLVPCLMLSYGLLAFLIVQREIDLSLEHDGAFAKESAMMFVKSLRKNMQSGSVKDTARFLEQLNGNGTLRIDVTDMAGNRLFGETGNIPIPARVIASNEVSQELQGQDILRFFLPLVNDRSCQECHKTGRLRGVVVVSMPFAKMNQEIADTRSRLILYGFAILAASVLIIIITTSRLINRPAENIIQRIRSYGEGNFEDKLSLHQDDWIPEITDALNDVVEKFDVFNKRLEEKVQERTAALERSAAELQKHSTTLLAYNSELEKFLSFSCRFFSLGKNQKELFNEFVTAIKDDLDYAEVELYCRYKYTGLTERAATANSELPKRKSEKLREIMQSGEIVKEVDEEGRYILYLPVYMPGGGNSGNGTDVANGPHHVMSGEGPGRGRPVVGGGYGHSSRSSMNIDIAGEGFLEWGLLIAVSKQNPPEHSQNVLKLAAMEIANSAEMYELLQYEKNMLDCLTQTHYIGMDALAASDISGLFNIWSNSGIIRRLFDGMALWLPANERKFSSDNAFFTENIGSFDIVDYSEQLFNHQHLELYDISSTGFHSAILSPLAYGSKIIGVIGFFKSYKRLIRPEERAAVLVIAEQISFNIHSMFLHRNLEYQNLKLKHAKEFNEKVFVSINSGIIVVNESGSVMTANPYALKKLELSDGEVIGTDFESLLPGILGSSSGIQGEGHFRLKNDREICIGYSVSNLDSDSQPGKIFLFRDITEIVTLRKDLRRKEYFSTIGKMASWIAHEVRNPVFAIASLARILLKESKDENQRKFVNSILKESNTLNLFVDDLLLYGKPLELKLEKTSVGAFLAEIAEGLKYYASEAGGVIVIGPIENELFVEMDHERIKQVFYNLIKNSLEAGADTVNVDAEINGGMVVFSLKDNGKGIKPSEMPEMFTPFFTTKKSGTGLGLPICKKIVEEHGGTIQIANELVNGVGIVIELHKWPDSTETLGTA